MIYDTQTSNYVNTVTNVTYPKEKVVAHLKYEGRRHFHAQGRAMDGIDLTEDFSHVKPHFMLNPEKRRYILYFIEDYPLKTALALEFLIKEHYPKEVKRNITLLRLRDVAHEYFLQEQGNVDDILDTIRQLLVLGYDITSYKFFVRIERSCWAWDSNPFADQYCVTDSKLKGETILRVMFESGLNIMESVNYEESIECYMKYVSEVTLFELVYYKLYNSRFNIMDI